MNLEQLKKENREELNRVISIHYLAAGRWFLVGIDGQKEINEGEIPIDQALSSWFIPLVNHTPHSIRTCAS